METKQNKKTETGWATKNIGDLNFKFFSFSATKILNIFSSLVQPPRLAMGTWNPAMQNLTKGIINFSIGIYYKVKIYYWN